MPRVLELRQIELYHDDATAWSRSTPSGRTWRACCCWNGRPWSWGACDGLFTPRLLRPLFDVAGQLGGELLERCRADAAREELFGALLRQVSEPAQLDVVVVEDVHWADEATVDLLRFLGRRIRNSAVLLIATYRDDGLAADNPLRVALGQLVNASRDSHNWSL